tara:strand:+ start:1128 stop:1376 length:249 start_codon:yes stop_codon:yes gene_type:complete
MSEKKKTKNDEIEELQGQLAGLTERNSQLMNTAQNLANQLNDNLGVLAQYERTIAVMSKRLSDKDNIIAQLNQQTQNGGEMA